MEPERETVGEDHPPDGRAVLHPDLSSRAMLKRSGERELTPEEFERHMLLPSIKLGKHRRFVRAQVEATIAELAGVRRR